MVVAARTYRKDIIRGYYTTSLAVACSILILLSLDHLWYVDPGHTERKGGHKEALIHIGATSRFIESITHGSTQQLSEEG